MRHFSLAAPALFVLAGHASAAVAQTTRSAEAADPMWESYLAHIAAADAHLHLKQPADARRWLAGAPRAFRQWEWRFLHGELNQALEILPGCCDGQLYGLALSPDGSRLATCGSDKLIRIWDASSLTPIQTLRGHESAVHAVAFSPDGRRLASASQDKTARVWNVSSGEEVCVFRGHEYPVGAVAFDPHGSRVASCAYHIVSQSPLKIEGRVVLWTPGENGGPSTQLTLIGGNKPLVALEFSPDGQRIAAGSWASAVYVWPVTDNARPLELKVPESGVYNAVDGIAFSPDGRLVAAASKDRTARVWDSSSGAAVATLSGHGGHVISVAFSHDGERLATGCADDALRIWETRNWTLCDVLQGHSGGVRRVLWSRDDSRILSASVNGEIGTWDAASPHYGGVDMRHTDACYAALFSPDGSRLYSCGYDGTLAIWDSANGRRLAHWNAHPKKSSCHALALTSGGQRLFSASYDKTIKVWNTASQELIAELPHDAPIYHASATADGRHAAASQDSGVWVWDVDRRSTIAKLTGLESSVQEIAFSPDGSLMSCGMRDGKVRIWRIPECTPGPVIAAHRGACVSTAFSPDGSQLASASHDGTIRLWNATTGDPLGVLHEGDESINRIAWSPDGARLAAASETAMLIDAVRGGVLLRLRRHGIRCGTCHSVRTAVAWRRARGTGRLPFRIRRRFASTR